MITYHVGDATDPDLKGQVVIAHVLSDMGAFGAGFAAAVAQRHPRARENFQAWARHDRGAYAAPFRLGAIQWVGVGRDINGAWWSRWVCNMVAQRGLRSKHNPHPLDLGALEQCLRQLAHGQPEVVAMPRIGCGLAGGTWDEVQPLVDVALRNVDVHVYDLPDAPKRRVGADSPPGGSAVATD